MFCICRCFIKKDLFIYFLYMSTLPCLQTPQKRASDPITEGCEPPCGCWELNSGPMEDQSVFLTTEPSLQPQLFFLIALIKIIKKYGTLHRSASHPCTRDMLISVLYKKEGLLYPACGRCISWATKSLGLVHTPNTVCVLLPSPG